MSDGLNGARGKERDVARAVEPQSAQAWAAVAVSLIWVPGSDRISTVQGWEETIDSISWGTMLFSLGGS